VGHLTEIGFFGVVLPVVRWVYPPKPGGIFWVSALVSQPWSILSTVCKQWNVTSQTCRNFTLLQGFACTVKSCRTDFVPFYSIARVPARLTRHITQLTQHTARPETRTKLYHNRAYSQ